MIEIQVNNLVKSFEVGKNVLDGLTFQVDQGERVGLLGRNGAGKTTLFKILTGELDYDEGSVVIGQGRRVGLISQIPVYPAGYTVEDVLRSAFSRLESLAEEMRILYVAMTRAKEKLTLTTAASRMLFGMTMRNPPSQFLEEIDKSLLEEKTSRRQSKRGIPAGNAESVQSISLLQQQMAASKKRVYQAQPKEFHVGERVRHAVFGDGTVLSITKMANDAMLEVGFDQVGTKRLMASHPKIKKLEE